MTFEDPGNGNMAWNIMKAVGAFLGTFVLSYVIYIIKFSAARIRALEGEITDIKITHQSNTEWRKYVDDKNENFDKTLNKIMDKIDSVQLSIDDRFDVLTKMIHELEVKFIEHKNGK